MSNGRRTPTLTDTEQAQSHFRSVVDRRHLATATALVVCCDSQGHPNAHLHVVDCDVEASPSDCTALLDELLSRVEGEVGPMVSGLAIGLTRPGGEEVQPYDRTWFRAFYRVCHQRGLTPYGVYTVTRAGARPVHIDDAA